MGACQVYCAGDQRRPKLQASHKHSRRGIGRAEVLVVVIIVLIALAIAVPFIIHQRSTSRELMCENRLRKLAFATLKHDELLTEFPGYRNLLAVTADDEERGTGWVFPLLPHLDLDDPTASGQALEIWSAYGPSAPQATRGQTPTELLPEVLCPAQNFTAQQRQNQPLSYIANCGQTDADVPLDGDIPPDWIANGLMFNHLRPPQQVVSMTRAWLTEHDGASATILFSENVDAGRWVDDDEFRVGMVWAPNLKDGIPTPAPVQAAINADRGHGDGSLYYARPSSEHPGGVNIALADGATRFMNDKVDYLAYVRQLTSNGAEVKLPGDTELMNKPWRD
jgi:prepilin-type processing-associated H-X9-DG protein